VDGPQSNNPQKTTIPRDPNMKNVFAVVALMLFLSVAPAKAQTESPPQTEPNLQETPEPEARVAPFRHPDRRFLIFAAIQIAATVADAETTQWALHSNPQAGEMNPLFGRHPDRPRMYGIALSITAVQILMQHHLKTISERTGKYQNAWMIGASVNTGFHTFLAVHNARIATSPVCPGNGSGCR
jgi:hypothetical protein